jgi:uncharacterized protein
MMVAQNRSAPVLYQLGRLLAYGLVGAVLGGTGAQLPFGFTIIFAILVLGFFLSPFGKNLLARGFERLPLKSPFSIGLGSALLPCGLLHAWLGSAVLSGSFVNGLFLMMILWATSIPALEFMGHGAKKILWPLKSRWPRGLPIAMGILALVPLALRAPLPSQSSKESVDSLLICHPASKPTKLTTNP